jgi:hypothetical protein
MRRGDRKLPVPLGEARVTDDSLYLWERAGVRGTYRSSSASALTRSFLAASPTGRGGCRYGRFSISTGSISSDSGKRKTRE